MRYMFYRRVLHAKKAAGAQKKGPRMGVVWEKFVLLMIRMFVYNRL